MSFGLSDVIKNFIFRLRHDENENSRARNAREQFGPLHQGAGFREKATTLLQAFASPNPNYIFGMDESHWGGVLDFTRTYERGMRFAFFKCVDGTVSSKYWDTNRPAAINAGLIVGDYAWLYPDKKVSCKMQANAYWGRLKSVPKNLPAVVDFEWTYFAGSPANPNYSDLDIWVTEFIRISGYKPILYSAAGYMNMFGSMPPALKGKFSALWIANYGVSSPTLPAGFTAWDFWQFSASLDQKYFAPSSLGKLELDGNYWKGDIDSLRAFAGLDGETTPVPADIVIPIFNGAKQIRGERYGLKVYVDVIDCGSFTLEVRNEDDYPSALCRKYGAQIAWNGDDWDRTTRLAKDNDSPSLMIFGDGKIAIGNWRTTTDDIQHTSGLRYLVQNGVNTIPLDATDPKYTERHARSVIGMRANGDLLHLTIDGDYPDKGALLYECAQIMIEFGAVTAFDQGGGGDTVEVLNGNVVNIPDDDIDGVHYERRVPQSILVKEKTMTNGTAKEKLGKTVTVRTSPHAVSGNSTSESIGPFSNISFVKVVDDLDHPGDPLYKWFDLGNSRYANYIYPPNGLRFDIITEPIPDPPPDNPPAGSKTITVIVKEDGYQDASVTVTQNPL